MDQATLLACHVLAFIYFGGVPREILYDNMRTAFQPDQEGNWRPTKRLAALAVHYDFVPKRCRVRRPETKGKVERTIGYLDRNFWPRMDGEPLSLSLLNERVQEWLEAICDKRLDDLGESRADRFGREAPSLKPLPEGRFDVRHVVPVVVSRESTIRYETNRYSVPPEHIGATALLYVHPLSRLAELVVGERSVRSFPLARPGSRSSVSFDEDRAALAKRWNDDRTRLAIARVPRKRRPRTLVEVAVRSPSSYEAFAEAVEARA
jgi:hypothetical protein